MTDAQAATPAYFDTQARAERLQLLLHLVRNVGEVIYLRAPVGAGKTRFAHKLLDILGADLASVWIRGGQDPDVAAAAADQLGLPAECAADWPDALLRALGDQDLLVVVDDADDLGLPEVERLAAMHERGGRLLLLGQGGLAHTNRDWDVQFVDLPAFDRAETTAFLRSQAGAASDRVGDDLAAALHQAAHGMPGPLLEALDEVLSRAKRRPTRATGPVPVAGRRRFNWQWPAGGAVVLLLVGLLVFQDRVNGLFEPDQGGHEPVLAEDPPAAVPLAPSGQMPPEMSGEVAPAEDAGLSPVDLVVQGFGTDEAALAPAGDETPGLVADVPDPLEGVMREALSAAEGASPGGAEQVATAAQAVHETAIDKAPAVVKGMPEQPGPEALQLQAADGAGTEASVATPSATAVPPAPVEERAVPAVARPRMPPPASAPAAVAAQAGVETRTAPAGGPAWLTSRSPQHYTLQLVGARDRAGVERYVRRHALAQPHAIFERQLDGRPWYSLVAGDYPDRAAALAARERLPNGVERSGVWPRTFGSIFESQ